MTQKEIFRRYDLKGSKIGREVLNTLPNDERDNEKYSFALKDLDFEYHKKKLKIRSDKKESLLLQMKEDTNFLKNNDILDYSFLVGIHTIDPFNQLVTTENNTRRATPKNSSHKKFGNTLSFAPIKLIDMENMVEKGK